MQYRRPRTAARQHGTRYRYVAGCRCDECREAHLAYKRQRASGLTWDEYVAKRRHEGPAERLRLAERWPSLLDPTAALTDPNGTAFYRLLADIAAGMSDYEKAALARRLGLSLTKGGTND